MKFVHSILFLTLLAAGPVASARAQAGCAPAGAAVPHLSLRHTAGGPVLRLENGPASGRALFLARFNHVPGTGPARPFASGCLAEARGTILFRVVLDPQGVYEAPLSQHTLLLGPTVSALVIPPGAALDQAALSNSVALGPVHPRVPVAPGSGGGGGPSDPVVVITEFMKDPAAVGDSAGEWIELYNPGDAPVDIEGWVLSDLGSDSLALLDGGQGIVVPAGGYLVLGKNDDPAVNGGVTVDFVLGGTTLSNGDDEIILSLADGTVVDEVHYDGGLLWPDEAGRSASLEIAAFDTLLNDDPANWCLSSTPVAPGSPDTGTPGLANDACSGG